MIDLERVIVIKEMIEDLQNNEFENYFYARLLSEVADLELDDDEIKEIFEDVYPLYLNLDYASIQGIGLALNMYLEENYDEENDEDHYSGRLFRKFFTDGDW
ncbi:MAG: hypothetical protein ACOCRX_09890 [Candidatus Woesearchaeota archaeon]